MAGVRLKLSDLYRELEASKDPSSVLDVFLGGLPAAKEAALASISGMAMWQRLSRFPIWVMRETALSSKSIRRRVSFSSNAILAGR
jgi:hypothetical protein